jgi:hypothetical protein
LSLKCDILVSKVCFFKCNLYRYAGVERDPTKWEGYTPKVEMIYDVKHGFLLSVYLQAGLHSLPGAGRLVYKENTGCHHSGF